MTILLHKPYLVKVATKGGGVKNTQNVDYVVDGLNDPLVGLHKLRSQKSKFVDPTPSTPSLMKNLLKKGFAALRSNGICHCINEV